MLVLRLRSWLVFAAAAMLTLLVSSCGSSMFPTPAATSRKVGTPSVATPVAQLSGLAAQGEQLFTKYDCAICHSLDGQRVVGPPLNGLYDSRVELADGKAVTANDAYLKLAIAQPDSQIVNGYSSGVMSGHIGQFESEIAKGNNLDALVAFIKSQP